MRVARHQAQLGLGRKEGDGEDSRGKDERGRLFIDQGQCQSAVGPGTSTGTKTMRSGLPKTRISEG